MKKSFIATILIAAVSLTGCATKKEEEKVTEYFDFTATEFVDYLAEEWLIDLVPITTIDDAEGQGKISTFTFSTENDSIDTMMHYMISYDDITKKISYISFNFDKSFMDDLSNARTRFRYHIGCIAEFIEPGIDAETVFDAISNVNGINEDADGMATYKGKDFSLLAYCLDTSFNASFRPAESE